MVEYYRDIDEATHDHIEPDKKVYNVITCAADLLDLNRDETISLTDKKKFIDYAHTHKEKNMIELFKHFNFPVPETEEEKEDQRFCLRLLYKKDIKGKLVPRENIFYNEKSKKGYKNFLDSSFTIIDNETVNDNKSKKNANKEETLENLSKMKKIKKLDRSIDNLRKSISSKSFCNNNGELNEEETTSINKLKYTLCIKHYGEQLGFKDLKKISLEEVTSLGQIYYIIKMASQENNNFNNPFNNCNMNNNENMKNDDYITVINGVIYKKKKKRSFIDKLIRNFRIADNNFGLLSIKDNESQILFNNLCNYDYGSKNNNNKIQETDSQKLLAEFNKIILESQKNYLNNNDNNDSLKAKATERNNESRYGKLGDNAICDEYRLILILKGKRIDFTDKRGKRNLNLFYFKFYLENRLLNTVEVIFNENVAKEKSSKFKKIMSQVKINEEVIMAFAYYPIIYFNNKHNNYELPPSGVESVYYIDSSKENEKVIKVYEEANKI